MSQQPEALKLADALESYVAANTACKAAAAELRRLHAANVYTADLCNQALEDVKRLDAENADLRAQVERLQAGGGVDGPLISEGTKPSPAPVAAGRAMVPLTNQQVDEIRKTGNLSFIGPYDFHTAFRAAERAHGINGLTVGDGGAHD